MARRGEQVDPSLASLVGAAPLAGNQPLLLQRVERRIESAFLELERVAASPLDLARDAVAVERTVSQNGQHQRGGIPFQ